MPDFDTIHLLKLLRSHTQMPAVPGFADADCLRALTAKLHSYILPLVKAEWQEHWLSSEGTTQVVPLVSGQAEYVLSPRGVGAGVRKAVLVGPNGARRALRLYEVDKQEERTELQSATQFPLGYVVRTGRLCLYPTPQSVAGWYLRMAMMVRPAQLCLPAACDAIDTQTDVTSTTATYSLQSSHLLPGGDGGLLVDIVRGTAPFEALAIGVQATFTNAGATVTLPIAAIPPEGLSSTDYLCPAGFAPFAQCPVELYELLATRTAAEMLVGSGDTAVAEAKAASLGEQRKDAVTLATPRTGEARLQGNGMNKWRGGVNWGWR